MRGCPSKEVFLPPTVLVTSFPDVIISDVAFLRLCPSARVVSPALQSWKFKNALYRLPNVHACLSCESCLSRELRKIQIVALRLSPIICYDMKILESSRNI